MEFGTNLVEGILKKRYKRFLADIILDNGTIITAHCPNTGSMLGVSSIGSRVFVSETNNPKNKLRYKWEIININNKLIGINTHNANQIVLEAILNKQIPELSSYNLSQKESIYKQGCRFDFKLINNISQQRAYLEVKSVTLSRITGLAEFPDAVTIRGLKHIMHLQDSLEHNANAYLLFLIQREDCKKFSISKDIDYNYYMALKVAINKGLRILAYNCQVSPTEIIINQPVNISI